MFSQDEYRGTFCPSPMKNFTPEATALINHTLVGRFKPPPTTMWRNSARIGAPQSPSALLSLDSLSSISYRSQFLLIWRSSAGIGAPLSPSALLSLDSLSSISFRSQFLLFQRSSAGIGTPQSPLSWLVLLYFIPRSIPPFLCSSAWDGSASIPTGALQSGLLLLYSIPHSLPTIPLFGVPPLGEHSSFPIDAPLPGLGAPLPRLTLLDFIPPSWPPPFRRCSASLASIPIGARQHRLGTLLFNSALLQHLWCTPLFHTALPIWRSSFRW